MESRLNKWARIYKIIEKLLIELPQISVVSILLRAVASKQAPWDGYFVYKFQLKVRVKVRAWGASWIIHLLQPRIDLIWQLVLIFLFVLTTL